MSLRWEDSWHKRSMESRKTKMLQDRGELPKEEGGVIGEKKAMHEDNFLSSWLREDGEDKKERTMELDGETKGRNGLKENKRRGRDGDCKEKVCQSCFD